MLTKEKLSEIANNATKKAHHHYKVEQRKSSQSTRNSYAIRLYDVQPTNAKWVATVYVAEGNIPGRFSVNFVSGRNNKEDRKVLQLINIQLSDYFNNRFDPKYYIRLLNNDYGYLALDEDEESWHVTSLNIAKADHQKTMFTAGEITAMSANEKFANVDLWSATEEVKEDER